MKILLDTHILIWALTDNKKLTDKARKIILNEKNEIFFSLISLWEIELKHSLRPEQIPFTSEDVFYYCQESGYHLARLDETDIFCLSALKRKTDAPPHKDPFDKMLICQAVNKEMTLLTHDALICGYDTNNILHV